MNELETAIHAARDAGELLMDYFGRVRPEYKEDTSIVTKADIMAEEKIKSILQKEFPGYGFIGEESGRDETESEYIWTVDPLDGTTNYTMQNPLFDVSIALTFKGEPILGVVYYPFRDELFYAEKGRGAFLNNMRISVSEADFDESILTFCNNRDTVSRKRMTRIFSRIKPVNNKLRQLGAGGLELAFVASGRTGAFFVVGSNSWDVSAGDILVREAGGTVTDFDGNPYSIDSKDFLASNGRIHDRLLGLIQEAEETGTGKWGEP